VNGWIKLHREILGKSIWLKSTVEQKAVLITIMLLASHIENEWEWNGKRYKVKPGQFITSTRSLAETAGVTHRNVRSALDRFTKYEFLTQDATHTGTLITIENWNKYQAKNECLAHDPTQNRHSNDTAVTHAPTTINKLKMDKNLKNERYACASFDRFWELYPKKKAKTKAEAAFKKLNPDDALLSVMLTALQTQRSSNDWIKDNGQYIPYPATWINQCRWGDEMSTSVHPYSGATSGDKDGDSL
jgi:hypothetical protein